MRKAGRIERALGRLRAATIRAARDKGGIAAAEFAVIVPVLVLLALGTADLGLAIYSEMQVQNSAEAGVGYAFLHGYDANAISSAITSAGQLSGLTATPAPTQFCGCPGTTGVTNATCGSTCSNGNTAGTYVTASATMVYHTLISYPIIPNQYTFVRQSTVRIK